MAGGFSLPSIGINPSQGELNTDVAATQGFSPIEKSPTVSSPFYGGGPATSAPGYLDQFFSKVGEVFGESAHMIETGAGWVARQGAEAIKGTALFAPDALRFGVDAWRSYSLNNQVNSNVSLIQKTSTQYLNGQLTLSEYKTNMSSLMADNEYLGEQSKTLGAKIGSDGGSTTQAGVAFISTVLAFASGGLADAAGDVAKAGAQDVALKLASSSVKDVMAPVEDTLARFAANRSEFTDLPTAIQSALKSSVTDSFLGSTAGKTGAQLARTATVNLLMKYPITFNYLDSEGRTLYEDMQTGKYGEAAKNFGFNALLLLMGGPIGHALHYGADFAKTVEVKTFGQSSFLDLLSQTIGSDDDAYKLYQTIKDDPQTIRAFQALEATNVRAANGQVGKAVYRIVDSLKQNGWDLSTETHQSFVDNVMGWHEAQTIIHDAAVRGGMSETEASRFVVGRWTANQKNQIGDMLAQKATVEDRLKAWEDWKTANPETVPAANANLDRQIQGLIHTAGDGGDIKSAVTGISASFSKFAAIPGLTEAEGKRIAKLGYVPITPKNLVAPFRQGTDKLVTNAAESSEFFQRAVQPIPVLQEVGAALTWMGLSPVRAQNTVQEIFKANIASNLSDSSLITGGGREAEVEAQKIIDKLSGYVNGLGKGSLTHPPVTDLRQLRRSEIMKALDVTHEQAAEVQKVLMDSMIQVPRTVRGLGDKLLDRSFQVSFVPRQYMRLQGAGRFAWNPFFKMKLASKTEILSQMFAGGKLPNFVPGQGAKLDAIAKMLEEKGAVSGGYTGEAANETGIMAGFKATKPELLRSQKRSLAGLVDVVAGKAGMNAEQFVNEYPQETRDMVDTIIHYNPNASFLNSPMARTLNTVIFPFRFNVKVSTIMAQTLLRQDALTQVAVLHGIADIHSFLTSREGQIWYSQNSDAIKLFSYFSPIETISSVMALGHIGSDSVASLGELGGLPLGFIPDILQAEGMWPQQDTSYIDPKTGQPGSQYIPLNAKAKLATAIASFLGTLFTYPGTDAGLPSKTGILAKVSEGLTGTSSADWNVVPETDLTPAQQQYQKAIEANNPNAANIKPFKAPFSPGTTAVGPVQNNANAAPIYSTPTGAPKAVKLKKAQEPIQLLPGQTSLGQV